MGKVTKRIEESGQVMNLLLVIGFLGIVWLMIYGNLSGNLGFASGSQGYNDTENVISNLTGGINTFFGFSNTFFLVTAIVLLIVILLGALAVVLTIVRTGKKGGSGFSG